MRITANPTPCKQVSVYVRRANFTRLAIPQRKVWSTLIVAVHGCTRIRVQHSTTAALVKITVQRIRADAKPWQQANSAVRNWSLRLRLMPKPPRLRLNPRLPEQLTQPTQRVTPIMTKSLRAQRVMPTLHTTSVCIRSSWRQQTQPTSRLLHLCASRLPKPRKQHRPQRMWPLDGICRTPTRWKRETKQLVTNSR